MKLVDFIERRKEIDDNLVIFIKNKNDWKSDIVLVDVQEKDEGDWIINGEKYFYFMEIFVANDFIDDWLFSLPEIPSSNIIAKRLFMYAINDA